jgi:hypothetical protein
MPTSSDCETANEVVRESLPRRDKAARQPAAALGVSYIAPDFDEPVVSIVDLFEGAD